MPVVIVCIGVASRPGAPVKLAGLYLRSYDPEFGGGRGMATWTADIGEAMTFEGAAEVHQFWTSVPLSRPVRDDGQPNRPLTAFTISIEAAPS